VGILVILAGSGYFGKYGYLPVGRINLRIGAIKVPVGGGVVEAKLYAVFSAGFCQLANDILFIGSEIHNIEIGVL